MNIQKHLKFISSWGEMRGERIAQIVKNKKHTTIHSKQFSLQFHNNTFGHNDRIHRFAVSSGVRHIQQAVDLQITSLKWVIFLFLLFAVGFQNYTRPMHLSVHSNQCYQRASTCISLADDVWRFMRARNDTFAFFGDFGLFQLKLVQIQQLAFLIDTMALHLMIPGDEPVRKVLKMIYRDTSRCDCLKNETKRHQRDMRT